MIKSLILGFMFFVVNKTNKWTFHNEEVLENATQSNSPVLICVWHGLFIFPLIYLKKNYIKTKIVSSTHKDSMILARILNHYGFELIKGSSSRGARNVIKIMMKLFKNSNTMVAITNDGPKGPPRIAKPGAINLAYKANAKIIFISGKSSSFWQLRTWDNFILPKPFANNHVYMKELTFEKFNAKKDSVDGFITNAMNSFQEQIDKNLTQ